MPIDDPLLYWKLDDVGAVADDSAGAHDGALHGGAEWIAGKIDGGLRLDGVDDYVDLAEINLLVAHTVAGWVKFRDAGDGIIFGGNAGSYALYQDATDFYYSATQGNFTSAPHGLNLPDPAWRHYAVTRQGARVRFYLDGQQLGADRAISDGALALQISRVGSYTNGAFFGAVDLDEVRIYNRELSAAEILELYAWRPNPLDPTTRPGHVAASSSGNASPVDPGHIALVSPGHVQAWT